MTTNSNENLFYIKLTRMEMKVLKLILCYLSDKEIAEKLCLSINTIKNHHQSIRNKTGAHKIGELIQFAERQGLINLDSNLKQE